MLISFRIVALAVTVTASAMASPLSAQAGTQAPPYHQSGPWTVHDRAKMFCALEHADLADGRLILSKSSTEVAYFSYRLNEPKDYYTPSSGIVWRFDNTPVLGRILAGRTYQPRVDGGEEAEVLFRQSDRLTIEHDGQIVVDIDLAGSAAAFRALKACADQYPGMSVPMMPPPPPPLRSMGSSEAPPRAARTGAMRAPLAAGPQPSNREVAPIAPEIWFANYIGSLPQDLFQVPHAVGFSVLVNAQGRVDACDVTSSSGSGKIDEFTCQTISRRARFDPQTDANGKPVPARFSSQVRWEVPEPESEPLKEGASD